MKIGNLDRLRNEIRDMKSSVGDDSGQPTCVNNFVHFRTQSSYSMLESTNTVEKLIDLAKKHNMPSVCLTDRGNLFASLEFSLSAYKKGVHPICGSILNLEFSNTKGQDFAEILLIAKDEIGYKNLLKLVSYSFIKNDTAICNHITFSDLAKYSEGIVALSGYTEGVIGKLLLEKADSDALRMAEKLQELLGDRFYFEVMRHGLQKEKDLEPAYLKLANDLQIPLIATNQVLFSEISMHDAHDVLLCISAGVVRELQDRKRVSNQCYFKSASEMSELFKDLPEAIENAANLAKRCYIAAEERPPSLPNFTDGTVSEEEMIRREAAAGLEQKLSEKFILENTKEEDKPNIRQEYFDRLEYELNVICKMNFSGYFLIVSDFIRWSKAKGIAVGPGRGSGAGSIVAWVLLITDLDPIKFGLLFERFLNPERVSMPDFDIDFCQERREEVISYVRSKYGDNRVGQIITFGKLQAKAVIKDVSRVMSLRYEFADYLTELVPFNAVNPVTLSQAINDIPELKDAAEGLGLYNLHGENELIKQVLSTALVLEGLHRHSSTHAAGVVIANEDMILTVPVCKDAGTNMLIVQYSMKYCELAGLIKFDFLGLQTLTVITKCLHILKSEGIDIDINKISYDDKKTYEMLSRGMSTGVFQFESAGMKSALRRLKPDSIEDIIALGALYRPGPMENIPTYIACKHGEQEADYLHPLLTPILKSTHGVIIYQEQVMEIARRLANYSLGSADLLRKAMGKKVKAEMDAQEEIFASGAKANGVPSSQAKAIFDKVAKFAGYGFNKAHASAYGVISYQTAYLKANYTAEFLVASLNLEIDNSDKINLFLQEAKNFGIAITAPSINRSEGFFTIEWDEKTNDKSIIFALGAIKNVTVNFGLEVVKERERGGLFKSVIDFIERIDTKIINRRLLENIIKAGCFDSVFPNRNSLLESVPKLMSYGTSFHQEKISNQFSLIAINSNSQDVIVSAEDVSVSQKAFGEFDVMGLFISNHPLSDYYDLFQQSNVVDSRYLLGELIDGSSQIKIAGIIVKKDARMSQRGRFITLVLSDPYGIFEVSIFSDEVLKNYSNLINVRSSVVVTCDAFKDQGGVRIIAKSFTSPDAALKDANFDLKLYPQNAIELHKIIEVLKQSVNKEMTNCSIAIFLQAEDGFLAKVSLPDCFYLDGKDAAELSLMQKSST